MRKVLGQYIHDYEDIFFEEEYNNNNIYSL